MLERLHVALLAPTCAREIENSCPITNAYHRVQGGLVIFCWKSNVLINSRRRARAQRALTRSPARPLLQSTCITHRISSHADNVDGAHLRSRPPRWRVEKRTTTRKGLEMCRAFSSARAIGAWSGVEFSHGPARPTTRGSIKWRRVINQVMSNALVVDDTFVASSWRPLSAGRPIRPRIESDF